jgi:hypothetical protein
MAAQALSVPFDVTWQRLAYSADMVDTRLFGLALPPKWRSSVAVYGYLVPEDQTAEAYPDARILYLKLTASITGWNPSEDLRGSVDLDEVGDRLDDLQRSVWEAIQGSGWAQTYWPCLGAIVQLAVFPGPEDGGATIEEYPHIIDFEPKKRELYESATAGSEYVSASAEKLSVQKGTTTLESSEKSAQAGFSIGGFGVGGGLSKSTDTTTVANRATDTSREDRETRSFTSSFSQMYQLFNGYHLGTNRALFVIAPRPHTVGTGEATDFNLIDGERRLEGVQEVLLVAHVPRALKGFCLQTQLDTGHDVQTAPGVTYMRARDSEDPADPPPPPPPPPPDPPDDPELVRSLVVTRRQIVSCAAFGEDDRLVPLPAPRVVPWPRPDVVFDGAVRAPIQFMRSRSRRPVPGREGRVALADSLNTAQHEVARVMVSGVSAGAYRPRPFYRTATFRRLAEISFATLDTDLSSLVKAGVIDDDFAKRAGRAKLRTTADVMRFGRNRLGEDDRELVTELRDRMVRNAVEAVEDIASAERSERAPEGEDAASEAKNVPPPEQSHD